MGSERKKGGAYNFSLGDVIIIPHADNLNFGTKNFSLEAWINTTQDSNATNDFPFIITKDDGASGNRQGYTLGIEKTTNEIFMEVFSADTQGKATATGVTINDGAWHHVVGVREGANLKIYVDGALEDTQAHPGGIVSVNTAVNVGIGSRFDKSSNLEYQGLIDEPHIYSRALTATQVAAIFNSGIPDYKTITSAETTLGGLVTVTSRVLQSTDDAEENLTTNSVGTGSTDLDLATDTGNGNVSTMSGMRFTNIAIPTRCCNCKCIFNTKISRYRFHSNGI